MKFKSEIVTQASGSIGGTTYAHNRGGMYRRARSIPTNPNSAAQQDVRNKLSEATTYWKETLTAAQRAEWETYAAISPVTDKLGDPLLLTGQQMWIRCMVPRLRAGLPFVSSGPTVAGLTELSGIVLTTNITDISMAIDNSNPWATETGGGLMVQTSRPLPVTVNYFKGPFRFLEAVLGDTGTPPSSPVSLDETAFGDSFGDYQGSAVFFRIVASDNNGRLSPVQRYRHVLGS